MGTRKKRRARGKGNLGHVRALGRVKEISFRRCSVQTGGRRDSAAGETKNDNERTESGAGKERREVESRVGRGSRRAERVS